MIILIVLTLKVSLGYVLCECTIALEISRTNITFSLFLRRSPELFLKKSGLHRTYNPLFIRTENSTRLLVYHFDIVGNQ